MVDLVADLIKEGANVNEKDHVSLNRVLSASALTGAPMRPPAAVCLRWCVSGVQGALRGRASPLAEAALVAVAPPLTAGLLSSTGAPACTLPPGTGMLRWCRRCYSTAPTLRQGTR